MVNNKILSSSEIAMRALSLVQILFQNEEITQAKRNKIVSMIKETKTTSDFSEVNDEFRKLRFGSIVKDHIDDFLKIFE